MDADSTDPESTLITISTNTFAKALDIYELRVRYTEPESGRERNMTAQIQYLNSDGTIHQNWWEVPDLTTWDRLMPEHGKTEENVLITGMVDFGKKTTQHRNLVFNRLAGRDETCGFTSLAYMSNNSGDPWIQKVSVSLENLKFTAMELDFRQTSVQRPMTGAILSVGSASKLQLDGINLTCNRYCRGYFAFISMTTGNTADVKMHKITVWDKDQKMGGGSAYTAGLIAYASGPVVRVTADQIKVDMPMNSHVGGICGRMELYSSFTTDDHVTNLELTGRTYVAGIAGFSQSSNSNNDSVSKGKITGEDRVGGLFGNIYVSGSREHSNWLVEDMTITATSGIAGGALGSTASISSQNAVVKNCTIEGTTAVGGLQGAMTANAATGVTHSNTQILHCTIRNVGTGSEDPSSMGTGGVIGRFYESYQPHFLGAVVRDCTIEGKSNVGGYIGAITNAKNDRFENIYIAEDVTITATNQAAGGIVGSGDNVTIKNCAVGATVKAFSNAGGIMGEVRLRNGDIVTVINNVYFKGLVTATGNYAGGVIGKVNTGAVRLTDDNLKNILVAADVRTGGDMISLWANCAVASASAGTGLVYVCEDSLLNGQTAKAIVDTAATEGKATDVTPQRPADEKVKLLVPAADFAKETFYSTRGFASTEWDYTDLTTYMPFTKLYGRDMGVCDTAKKYNGKSVGILLPEAETLGQKTVVYASGVDRINVEVPLPTSAEVTVNGKTYTPDENGVVTLRYRFGKDDVQVGEETYTADSLSRKVMTCGDWWYYIAKDGTIHYGNAVDTKSEMTEPGIVAGVTNAVHLWQGLALTADGKVYRLNGDTATETEGTVPAEEWEQLPATPFWMEGDVRVYYNFSYYKEEKIPYRVFMLEGAPYTVSPAQHVLYDGVILSSKTEYGVTNRYFALVDKNSGTLTAYLSNMRLGGVDNKGIVQISNNLGYKGTVLLAYYADGNVVGVDYTTGKEVCSTRTAGQRFAAYVRQTLTGILRGGTTVRTDGSFFDAETVRDTLGETGGVDQSGGTAIGGGTGANGTAVTKPGETETPAGGSDIAAGTGESVEVTGDAQSGGQSQAAGAGESVPDQTGTDSGAAGGETGAAGDVTDIPTGGDGTADGEITGAGNTDNAGSDPDTSETSGGSNGTAGAQDGQAEAQSSVLMELFGSAVPAYSTRTGRYELLDTASLSAGGQMTREEAIQQAQAAADQTGDGTQSANGNGNTADKSADPEQAEGESGFSVAWGPNRSLNAGERQGFTLIALAAVIAGIGLVILYRVVIRKHRK